MEDTRSLHREAGQSTLSFHVEPKHESVSTATPLLDLNDATLMPQGWPTSPSRIKPSLSTMLLNGAFDIALCLFSSCFLIFSLVVMYYDDAPTSENPMTVGGLIRATKYSPTIFPILFASVVGRATHAILLWRLEKGERIQILDSLATSTSLTSTVTSQIHLRQINIASVLLVMIWALSPIGGQASLRQMSIGTVVKRSEASFHYVVPTRKQDAGVVTGTTTTNLVISAIIGSSSTKASPIDLWGNVKIPKIEHYEKIAEPDRDGWFDTRLGDDDLATYTSLVGIPTDGGRDETTTTDYDFHIQTEYLHLICASDQKTESVNVLKLPSGVSNTTSKNKVIWWSENDVVNRSKKAVETLEPFSFSYSKLYWNDQSSVSCSTENSYVEVEVFCAMNSTCRAVKVRRSQLPQLSPASTLMDLDQGYNARMFMSGFLSSVGEQGEYTIGNSVLDRYLKDPSLGGTVYQSSNESQISDEAWSDRLGHLLNSYWTCIYGVYTITGGIHADTAYNWDGSSNITFEPPKIDPDGSNSTENYEWTYDNLAWNNLTYKSRVWPSQGNKYEHIEVIKAHMSWAIILAIASLVLIASSSVPPIVRHFLTTGPDIAINFSSLATRNNSYVPIPASGSYLPAADRFRLLKDLRLRFADVEGKSDVGNLVIAAQGVENAEYSRIRKGRLYE